MPQATAPGSSSGGSAALLRSTYQAILAAKGVPYLSHDDPAMLMLYQAVGGLSPQAAAAVSQTAATYYQTHGYAMTDTELDGLIATTKGPTGANPAETNPMVGVGAQVRQAYGDLSAARPGTWVGGADPQFGAAVGAAVPGLTAQQQAQIAERGADFYRQTGVAIPDAAVDQYAGQVKGFHVPLPHQMDPGHFDAMMADPVAKGLFQGTVKAAGWDWDTYQQQHYASRPTGVATPSTGASWAQPTGVWT